MKSGHSVKAFANDMDEWLSLWQDETGADPKARTVWDFMVWLTRKGMEQ